MLLFTLFLLQTKHVFAHAADVAYLDLYIFNDQKHQSLAKNQLVGVLSISWVQMSYLAKDYLNEELPASEQKIPLVAYDSYFRDHLVVTNDVSPCTVTFGTIPKTQDSEIVFGKGLPVPFTGLCNHPIHKLSITSTMFLEDFPLHSTILSVYTDNTKQTDTVLTKSYQTFSFTPVHPTSPPLSSVNTTKTPFSLSLLIQSIAKKFVKNGKTSLPLAIIFVFFLGMLHTLEAGHSKTILASYVLNKRISFKRAMTFAGVFTFTHLADIFILGIFFLITNTFVDLYAKLSLLNIIALYVLLFISVYMVIKSLGEFLKHKLQHNHNHTHTHAHEEHEHTHPWDAYPNDIKKQLFMAFLIGLSPCIFGWSIFMVIISLRQAWTVIPVLFSFGLGIFTALALVVFILTKMKLKLADKYAWVGELSPVLSYILLAVFALQALIK